MAARKQPEKTRVLVVEDEARLREMLVSAISEMGFSAGGAPSAEDAIRALEQVPCDIALLDLNLPGMGGLELFQQIRGRCPDAAVIILTGYGDLEAAQQAIHLDVVDFLTKPASLGEIEAALDRAYRRTEASGAGRVVPEEPATLQDSEREQILAAVERNKGNRAATAAELGISVRTLYYRLAEYERQGYLK